MSRLSATLRGVTASAVMYGLLALGPAGTAQAEAVPFVAGGSASGLVTRATAFSMSLKMTDEFSAFGVFTRRPLKLDLAALDPLQLVAPPRRQPVDPFGVGVAAISRGAIVGKWSTVKKHLAAEHKVLERCRADAGHCPAAAKSFLALVDKAQASQGWRRIAEINRSITLNIRPMSDLAQYGVEDYWATPLMLFASHRGDCEDYAIAKYVALREIGIAENDVRLVI